MRTVPPPMVPTSMEGTVIVISRSWPPLILEEQINRIQLEKEKGNSQFHQGLVQ